MRYFADETNCLMLGEGVETDAELRTLDRLGVVLGQGFLLGRPAPVAGSTARASDRARGALRRATPVSGKRT
jgi:EAL domain-containing protein (putative c-di-GMP-specific phosphodiesterase class I)